MLVSVIIVLLLCVGLLALQISQGLPKQKERSLGSLVLEKVWKIAFMLSALFAISFFFVWLANILVYMVIKVLLFVLTIAMTLFVALFIIRAIEEILKEKKKS